MTLNTLIIYKSGICAQRGSGKVFFKATNFSMTTRCVLSSPILTFLRTIWFGTIKKSWKLQRIFMKLRTSVCRKLGTRKLVKWNERLFIIWVQQIVVKPRKRSSPYSKANKDYTWRHFGFWRGKLLKHFKKMEKFATFWLGKSKIYNSMRHTQAAPSKWLTYTSDTKLLWLMRFKW